MQEGGIRSAGLRLSEPRRGEWSMKLVLLVGMATVGGMIAFKCLPQNVRGRLTAAVGHRVTEGLGYMMQSFSRKSLRQDHVRSF